MPKSKFQSVLKLVQVIVWKKVDFNQIYVVNKMVLINMLYKRGKNRQIVKLDILNQFQRNLHGIIHRSP